MKKIEDWCVDCGLPCLGNSCPYRNVEVHYCDRCGEQLDVDEWGEEGEEELCFYCRNDEEDDESEGEE